MDTQIVIAIIAATVAVISAILGVYGQIRTTRLENQFVSQREVKSNEAKARALISKYRDPLLRSANDLQSRLFNIIQLSFLPTYCHGSDRDKAYAVQNTLYVVGEYLGWVEILRREVQFLDLGDAKSNHQLVDLLERITGAFLTDSVDPAFRLFRGEQRAIGEIMLTKLHVAGAKDRECIGFAEFCERLQKPGYSRWFIGLQNGIELLADAPSEHEERLVIIQHAIIDLIDFLDSECVRISKELRQKVSTKREIPLPSTSRDMHQET